MGKIPAGLFDGNVEIFEHEGKAFALFNGNKIPIHRLPNHIYSKLFDYFLSDKDAFKATDNKCMSLSDRFNQFLICRFGSLDHNPDLDLSQENFTPEFYDCGKRGNCPFEFVLCDKVTIKTESGDMHVTRKEVQIIRLIASGNTDVQTADRAGIALNTLLTHKKNIYSKLGVQSQAQLTLLAVHNNLIQ